MAGDALFIGWGQVVRGREKKALEVFGESQEYYGSLQQDGRIEGFETALLAPHGGGLAGYVLLRGERGALDEIRRSERFQTLTVRASMIVDEVGVIDAYTGEALGREMGFFQAAADEFGS